MELSLEDKTIVVTGGRAGIGLEITRHLLAEGARVATCARDLDGLREVLAPEAEARGDALLLRRGDVLHRPDVDALVEDAVALSGGAGLAGLVCNAGAARDTDFRNASPEDWAAEVDLKILSTLHAVDAALPHLVGGRIVVISSLVAQEPIAALTLSSAARAIALRLTDELAAPLAERDVRLSSILLGPVVSDQWRRRYDRSGTTQPWDEWLAAAAAARSIPVGRFGRPEEVAYAATLLLSPEVPIAPGAVLELAGGLGQAIR